ncbi:MAG: amino acid ABC transporter permease [Desulfobacterales bacterium]|nr:MAG: amino acid ABC transporter permease [Desulfobacterales bacterium]
MTGLDFSVVLDYYPVMLAGLMWTSILCACAIALSLVGGVPLALAGISRNRILRSATGFFIWVFRGTPLLLQLFLIYFGLPQVGIYLSPIVSGIIGLGIHYAVYNSDVMRAGIVAVETGQHEASRSLGLSRAQTMRKVIIPQALRNVTPALGNNLIALLKESALVSIITVPELTLAAQRAISETFRPFEFYLAAGVIYYDINYFLELGLKRVELKTALSR